MQYIAQRFLSQSVQDVWRWWHLSLLAKGRPPRHDEVDPAALRRALAKLWLVEWQSDNGTFRYRLAGEAINKRYGTCLRGKTTAELFTPAARAAIDTAWRRILSQPAVAFQSGKIYPDQQTILFGERLALPLLDDVSLRPRFILGVTDHPPGFPENRQTVNPQKPGDSHRFFPVDAMLPKVAAG